MNPDEPKKPVPEYSEEELRKLFNEAAKALMFELCRFQIVTTMVGQLDSIRTNDTEDCIKDICSHTEESLTELRRLMLKNIRVLRTEPFQPPEPL